jgi:hypothetical protein
MSGPLDSSRGFACSTSHSSAAQTDGAVYEANSFDAVVTSGRGTSRTDERQLGKIQLEAIQLTNAKRSTYPLDRRAYHPLQPPCCPA